METKKIRNGGFTLLETLLTVAILIILMALSAVGVARYKDYLDVTELDNAARDIYMAAENRAVLLQNSGASIKLLSSSAGGTDTLEVTLDDGTKKKLLKRSKTELVDLLPAGTIDPELRKGDFYVLYDPETGHVAEVFYAKKGTTIDGTNLAQFRTDRSARVNLFRGGDPLVGYYNGGIAGEIGTKPLPTPGVEVFIDNGEELTLKVTYTLPEGLPAGVTYTPSVKLYYPTNSTPPIELFTPTSTLNFDKGTATFEKVLDSLAKDADGNSQQFKDLGSGLTGLGKNFTVTAGLKLTATGWIDSAYYADGTDNSLFAKQTGDGDTAYIENLRHLQNLCSEKSTYAYMSTDNTCSDFVSGVGNGIQKAEQLTNIECRQYKGENYNFSAINNPNLTSYDGKGYELRSLYSKNHGGGLFNQTGETGMIFQHIRLIAPEIRISHKGGVDPAGLVMMLTGTSNTLDDVWAVNATIYGEGGTNPAAGGLVGIIGGQDRDTSVTINNCRVFWQDETSGVPKPVSQLLTKDEEIDYKITSKFAGGLVGICSSNYNHTYTLNITNSFAATTIKSSHPNKPGVYNSAGQNACIGGLVGGTGYHDATEGTVKVTIKNSYADCYFGEDWNEGKPIYIGGLVGSNNAYNSKNAELTMTNCYAAGFIVNPRDHVKSAGLANDTQTSAKITAQNCYSVVRVIKKDDKGKEMLEKPETPLYGTIGEPASGSVRYLSKAEDVTEDQFGNAFEYIDADNSPETHVYDLRYEMSKTPGPADEALKLTPPYPFPGLKNVTETVTKPDGATETVTITFPHYGDWADLEDGKTLIPAGLAYYETYGSGDTAVHGAFGFHEEVSLDTLKKDLDNPVVTTDGYALVFPKGEEALSGTYKVTYGSSSPYTLTISESSMKWTGWSLDVSAVSLPVTQGTGEDAKEYILIPLPDRVMTDALSGTSPSFYQKLQVDLLPDSGSTPVPGLTRSFWFNPHFAKTVVKQDTKPSDPAGTEASAIIVRTARHLRNLGMIRYTPYGGTSYQTYVYNKHYYFKQELDLDYATYKGYLGTGSDAGFPEGISETNPYVQDCIGTAYKTSSYGSSYTAKLQFRGTYDGGYHIIRNVVGSWTAPDNYTYSGGLFGMVGEGGVLKNIAYAFNPNNELAVTPTGEKMESYGALVGINEGTVNNCAVYGFKIKISPSKPVFQAGGLAGESHMPGVIENCSAEVVSMTITRGYAGGLVGRGSKLNGSDPGEIKGSYAVGKIIHPSPNYDESKEATISGLANEGKITDCYAAVQLEPQGFDIYSDKYGLSNKTSHTNSFFLLGSLCYRDGGNYIAGYETGYMGYYQYGVTYVDFCKKEDFLSKPVSTVHDDISGKKWAPNYAHPNDTFPYFTGVTGLTRKTDGTITSADVKPIHYGLWNTEPIAYPEISLFYYEKYNNGEHGFYQLGPDGKTEVVNTLKDDLPVVIDGYALATPRESQAANFSVTPEIRVTYGDTRTLIYGGGGSYTMRWKGDPANVGENGLGYTNSYDYYDQLYNRDTKCRFWVTVGGTNYEMLRLPFEWVNQSLKNSAEFYQTMTVMPIKTDGTEVEAGKRTFRFNPHFAKAVSCPDTGSAEEPAAPPAPTKNVTAVNEKDAVAISVRTIRQFKMLSRYTGVGMEYLFRQGRDVEDTSYVGYDDYFQYTTADVIGSGSSPFSGVYDGQGYPLSINQKSWSYPHYRQDSENTSEYAAGLFCFSTGTLKNVYLKSSGIKLGPDSNTSNYNDKVYHAGILVGWNKGTVENCIAKISCSYSYTFKNTSNWKFPWNNKSYVGSLVGRNDGSLKNCTVTGSLSITMGFEISTTGNARKLYELKKQSPDLRWYLGGMVGRNFGTIEGCGAELQTSTIRERGRASSEDNNSSIWKEAKDVYRTYAGGLVGSNEQSGVITSSYALGNLGGRERVNESPNELDAMPERSGFAARNLGTIRNCYTAMNLRDCGYTNGAYTSRNRRYVFCNPDQAKEGTEQGTFENCYYLRFANPEWTYNGWSYKYSSRYTSQPLTPSLGGVTGKPYGDLTALTIEGMGKVEETGVYPFPVGTKDKDDKWYYFGVYWPVEN